MKTAMAGREVYYSESTYAIEVILTGEFNINHDHPGIGHLTKGTLRLQTVPRTEKVKGTD